MGTRLRTKIHEPSLFFVTTTFQDWQNRMELSDKRDAVEEILLSLSKTSIDALMGYVLMNSHVHILVSCSMGGMQLSEFMRSFKSLTARRVFPELKPVWMKRFDDLVIKSEKQFKIKLNYIHENPVRAGFVETVTDWRWSSARFWLMDEPHPILTRNWDWLDRGVVSRAYT